MKGKLIQVILEFFEGNELCNKDGEYSENDNLKRAEEIYENYNDSKYTDLDKYLIDHNKNNEY